MATRIEVIHFPFAITSRRPTTARRATKCSPCGINTLSPGIITYYRDPLMIVEGHMQYVWDEKGRRYLDAFAGIVTISVGHCHPKIVERCATDGTAAAHDDDLPAPGRRAVRREAGRENAARAHAFLLHQQRQRGERSRDSFGPRIHGQPGRDRAPQRLPRRHVRADGPHRARQLEVQKQQRHERPSHACPATATAARTDWSIRAAA